MAKKKTEAAGGMTIFAGPGITEQRTAINLSHASVIKEDVDGHFFIEVNGVSHRVKSEATLEDLAEAAAGETASS